MTCDNMATRKLLATVGFWKGPSCFQGIKMFSISCYQLLSIPTFNPGFQLDSKNKNMNNMNKIYSLLSQDAHHLVNRDALKI